MILCAFCKFVAPYINRPAVYIIDGQGVCQDHVDNTGQDFGRALTQAQNEANQ